MIYVLLLLLVVSREVAGDSTAYVGDPTALDKENYPVTTLLAALQDARVTNVVLVSNYRVGEAFHDATPAPLQIQRNVTISGLHGVADELDMDYSRSAIRLCPTCVLTIRNLTLANARRGIGSVLDFVVGEPGSRVVLEDMYQLRDVCVDGPKTILAMMNSARNDGNGSNSTTQQLVELTDVTFNGQSFPDSVHSIDFAVDHPLAYEEGQGASGGYVSHEVNVTRLCRHLVSDECLKDFSPSECVLDLTDDVLGQEHQTRARHTNHLAVAVGVPVAVVGAALIAAIAIVMLLRNRRKQQQHGLQSTTASSPQFGKHSSKDLEAMVTSNSGSAAAGPLAGGKGWEITSTLTAPLMADADTSRVQFGELLGAGSFGRVYKASWAGREVAVKVIEHDTATSAAVENEVQLMLSFDHPNIVRAYHCINYIKTAGTNGGTGSALGRSATEDVTESCDTGGSSSSSRRNPIDSTPTSAQQLQPSVGLSATANQVLQRNSSIGNSTPRHHRPPIGSSNSVGHAGASATGFAAMAGYKNSAGSGDRSTPPSSRRLTGSASRSSRAETWLVQEYCDCGTLGGIISEWEQGQESQQQMLCRLLLLQDCAQGLKVLHSKNVVHGDLNARNVLVSSDSSSANGLCAKLADLGLSRSIKQHKTHRITNTVGTMSHMPPELLRYGRMSAAVDIYAFGVMMWEVFTGQPAFKKLHYGQFFETVVLRNLRPMIPAGMPADYQLLMEHCWATEPADRPSIDRILECLRYMIQERQISDPAMANTTADAVATAHGPGSHARVTSTFKRPSLLSRQPEARFNTKGSKDSLKEASGSLVQPSQTDLRPMPADVVDTSSGKLRYLDPSVRGTRRDHSIGTPCGLSSPAGSVHGGPSTFCAVDADTAKDNGDVAGAVLMKVGDDAPEGTDSELPELQLVHQSTEEFRDSKWFV